MGEQTVRHPIRFKIFLVCLIPTAALLAAAVLNSQYLGALGASAEQILSQNYKSIRAAQEARKALERVQNALLETAPEGGLPDIPAGAIAMLSNNLQACRENITETGERDLIERLFVGYGRYLPLIESRQGAAGGWDGSDGLTNFLALTAEMLDLIDELVTINEEAMERAEQRTRQLARRAQRNAAILFGVVIVAILALSYFLSYRIARPLMTLANTLAGTREGSGVYPTVEPVSNDEIGFLTEAFNRLFTRLEIHDRYRDDILAAEKEKVRRGEEAKGKFMADISHQLKTPMTSLAMSVSMLRERGRSLSPETRDKLIATAHDDCTRLATLINELVDASRLEALARPRPKETLDVSVMIRECLAPLQKQAEAKGVALDIDIAAGLRWVTIDSFRFPWVITNLVGNALRYTDRGGRIRIKAYQRGLRCCFECHDTGSGIDPAYLPQIFDRYTQFSERGKSGTIGLGLAIVKDIIEQHGGDIQVHSRPGEGTRFTFWIPGEREVSV
ncbi:MAG: HAMP domain-containing sensor histidine kinase [Desulfobacteraceae bacterium]|nr:HAMP domain-containing sensor histidine kinase [Desulfobacteraceae bacterium]